MTGQSNGEQSIGGFGLSIGFPLSPDNNRLTTPATQLARSTQRYVSSEF